MFTAVKLHRLVNMVNKTDFFIFAISLVSCRIPLEKIGSEFLESMRSWQLNTVVIQNFAVHWHLLP